MIKMGRNYKCAWINCRGLLILRLCGFGVWMVGVGPSVRDVTRLFHT